MVLAQPAGLGWRRAGRPRKVAEQGAALSALDYVDALNKVVRMRTAFIDIFDRYDAILTPCFAALPWAADASHPETIDGKSVTPRGHAVFTAYANVGGLPGISLPCRPSRSGLPIAIQLVSAFGADELLLVSLHSTSTPIRGLTAGHRLPKGRREVRLFHADT